MGTLRAIAYTAAIFSVLATSSATALEILPTSVTRSLSATAGSSADADSSTLLYGEWTGAVNADDPADFNAGVASANQVSRVPVSILGGDRFILSLDATATDGAAAARSEFEVVFQVDEAVGFAIQADYANCYSVNNCLAAVAFYGPGVSFLVDTACCPQGSEANDAIGVLQPNVDYTLSAIVTADCAPFDGCSSPVTVDALLVVPEPGTGALVLTGLVALRSRRRCSSHRRKATGREA